MALGHWLKDYLGPKASGEGGGSTGGNLVVTVSVDRSAGTGTADKTFAEIVEALPNAIALLDVGGGYAVFEVEAYGAIGNVSIVNMVRRGTAGSSDIKKLTFKSDGTIQAS